MEIINIPDELDKALHLEDYKIWGDAESLNEATHIAIHFFTKTRRWLDDLNRVERQLFKIIKSENSNICVCATYYDPSTNSIVFNFGTIFN